MPKICKKGKIVVLLNGRYAGRKAIIVNVKEEGTKDQKFAHALVAGIDRYPRKVTRAMKEDRIKKRTQIKPFVKTVNLNHIMPTRYQLTDMDLAKTISEAADGEKIKSVKKVFEDRYRKQAESKAGKNKTGAQYFFKKLRF
jgi:large subunit ribosomal protein L27e